MNIIRLLPLLLIFGVLVAFAVAMLVSAHRQRIQERSTARFEGAVQSLALDHLDVAPVLAKAVLDRLRRGPAHGQPDDLAMDLVDLAIEHRETEPEFSTILTDTIRTWSPTDRPREI